MKLTNKKLLSAKGFTLIELLVVIAVLGILTAIVLVAVNPGEQMARARDASRKAAVTQVGRVLQTYYTANSSSYPPANAWNASLLNTSEIKIIPTNPSYSNGTAACTSSNISGFCYKVDAGQVVNAVIYANLESQSSMKARTPNCGTQASTWFVWSTAVGRGGIYCGTEAGITSTFTDLL